MKHNLRITAITLLMFLSIQLLGLFVVSNYYQKSTIIVDNTTIEKISYDLPYDTSEFEKTQNYSYIYIIFGILLTTILLLFFLKKLNTIFLQIWFFLSVFISSIVCLNAFLNFFNLKNTLSYFIILIIAFTFAYLKSFTNRLFFKNLIEFFIYPGIVSVMIPMFNMFSVIILLILISIYDIIAVRKTKHMIFFAEEQRKRNLFAGININYEEKEITNNHQSHNHNKKSTKNQTSPITHKKEKLIISNVAEKSNISKPNYDLKKIKDKENKSNKENHISSSEESFESNKIQQKTAILGGGDIAFPLLFSSVVLINHGFFLALVCVFSSFLGLLYLFLKSQKEKYYPAMPYITSFLLFFYFLSLFLI